MTQLLQNLLPFDYPSFSIDTSTTYTPGTDRSSTASPSSSSSVVGDKVSGVWNVILLGAKGDGVTDDTAALEAAHLLAQNGDTIFFPSGRYRITRAWQVSKSVNIVGSGVTTLIAPLATIFKFALPNVSPFLVGSVIVQTTAGEHGISITSTAPSINISNLGICFEGTGVRFLNTGHGVYAEAAELYLTHHEQGLQNFKWSNFMVFGHDGNHYAAFLQNALLGEIDHFYAFGGGGFYSECDSEAGNDGNLTLIDIFISLFQLGTAHGMHLKGRADGTSGTNNLFALIRPQVNWSSEIAVFPETTTPIGGPQKLFFEDSHVSQLTIFQPDFEPTSGVSVGVVQLGGGSKWISPESNMGSLTLTFWQAIAGMFHGNRITTADSRVSGYGTTLQVLTAGAQAGASAPTPLFPAATSHGDYAGQFTFGTGTGSGVGELAKLTFANAHGTNYTISLTPMNAATAALGLFVVRSSANFTVNAINAPTDSQAATVYAVDYQIRGDG